MVTIAVDAMGGDHAPKPEVDGAIRAVRHLPIQVILVGKEDLLRAELAHHQGWEKLPIKIVHASEVVAMDESAVKSLRSKKDSSIRVACRLVREGAAQGVVSAGNTGAVMATAKTVLGVVHGIDRPALASAFPTLTGKSAVIVDVGANVDCSPEMLAQFALMGHLYSKLIFKVAKPRIGLLSIGEEEHKGNELTRGATPLLKAMPINFIGNVEGRDVYTGHADVIVCDGFIGNVALKVSEGLVDVMKHLLQDSLKSTIGGQIGAVFSRSAFAHFKKRVDYSEFGGAPLLGVKGVAIIGHGRSNANAIKNAIRVASEFASEHLNTMLTESLDEWHNKSKARIVAD